MIWIFQHVLMTARCKDRLFDVLKMTHTLLKETDQFYDVPLLRVLSCKLPTSDATCSMFKQLEL
jgi:hypothetical protein